MGSDGWWRRWPSWAGWAAAGWALPFGVVPLVSGALYGVPGLGRIAGVVLVLGAGLAVASVRPWGRRLPWWAVPAGLWTVVILALAGSTFVLLDLVGLVVDGSIRGRGGRSDVPGFVQRLGFVVVAVLFLLTALAWRGRCPRCGGPPHPPGVVERPVTPASARVRRIAHLGGLAFVPYYACHLLRFADLPPFRGGRFADPGDPFIPVFILCTALPAEFLLLGLVHSWGMVFPRWTLWLAGRRVPRFLPVVPVWLIAPTLAGYGTGAWVYALLRLAGVVPGGGTLPDYLLGCAAATAFAGYGWALGIAAVSYQRRTRPRCVPVVSERDRHRNVAAG